jgi:hypothetical protein
MHVLTTSTDQQTIKIVPRRDNQGEVTVRLYDKSTRKTINYEPPYSWQTADVFFNEADQDWNETSEVTFTYGDVFSTVSGEFNLRENEYYGLKLIDSAGELYKGIIFCTNQTDFAKFNVSKDDYVIETSYDNEYIIL